jgi:hypothetical protein
VTSEGMYVRRVSVVSMMPVIQLFAGLWLLASPYFLQYTLYSDARFNVGLVAPMVIAFALTRLAVSPPWFWVSWVNVAFGIWLVISPFAFGLGHITDLMLNFVITGAVIAITGVVAYLEKAELAPDR